MIPNQWYAILPSKDVRPGGIASVRRMGLDLALFRTADGTLGCVADRCTHRGAALSGGVVRGNCIACPFHGLQFEKDGRCAFVPAEGRASKQDLSRFNVKAYAVREAHGIIYLWYGDAKSATGEPPFFDGLESGGFVYREIQDHWATHYSRAIENQLDVVHVPIVHYNTIGRGNKTLINGPKVVYENGELITSANNEVDRGQPPKPPAECVIKDTHLVFKFPNIWMNYISDRVRTIIYFAPVDDENTILYIRFYGRLTGNRVLNRVIAYGGGLMSKVIERQDKRVVITQKPKASSLMSGEKLLVGDGPIVRYRREREALIAMAAEDTAKPRA